LTTAGWGKGDRAELCRDRGWEILLRLASFGRSLITMWVRWNGAEIVLMVVLGRVEGLEWNDLRNDGLRIDLCGVELSNIGLGDFLLLAVRIENRRAALRAAVGPGS
jgi:hypothetical protein